MANTIFGLFRTNSNEDPLADTRALAAWVENLPDNDFLGSQEAMVRALEDMGARQPKITHNRILAVLELDRVSMPIQARLLKQFLQPALSEAVRQRLWHANDDLARWFAFIYETLFESLQDFFLGKKAKAQAPGVAARMFYYRGQQAKYGLFRYERWIPGRWKGLHAGFEAAQERALARVPFAFAAQGAAGETYCVEQEFVQILLMQRINTGNLSAAQIEMAALWLRVWARHLAFTEPPLEGSGFWLDLGQGDGLLARKPQSPQGRLLYLNIAPLQRAIANGRIELSLQMQRTGTPVAQAAVAERLSLLQRLEQLWRPQVKPTERRGERVESDQPVQVVSGLPEIVYALQGANPKHEAMFRRFRQGDPAEIASGRVPPPPTGAEQDAIDFDPADAGRWFLRDTSESGCKLVSQSREAAEQKLGSLLGIQDAGDSRCRIGVVRRLKKFSGGQTELGVEIVAENSIWIAPKPAASRDTGYSVDGVDVSAKGKAFDALYLPPMQRPGRVPRRSVVLPAQEYAQRRRLLLTFAEKDYAIELSVVLERGKDWVWSGFDIVAEAA